jgi:superfamily II DNA helicase RecQ
MPAADYKKLGVLKQQFPDTPIIALTATATTQASAATAAQLQART